MTRECEICGDVAQLTTCDVCGAEVCGSCLNLVKFHGRHGTGTRLACTACVEQLLLLILPRGNQGGSQEQKKSGT